MTERLYYLDSRLLEFDARVTETSADGTRVYLDRTAFYPGSGGQPFDTGMLGGRRVLDVIDEEDRIVHVLAEPLTEGAVRGEIDGGRRFDHMQQHTGQHLLSAVFADLLKAPTLSFHLGAESCTIDIGIAAVSADQARQAERRANELVFENRPIAVSFEHVSQAEGLRKPSDRAGEIRIVTIAGLDRSACGGTHVAATGEIGPILLRKLERVRGNVRVEFMCGLRAVDRAHRDYDALSSAARTFSAPLDDVPARVAAQVTALQDADKARLKLAGSLARLEGRQLFSETASDAAGVRFVARTVDAITDETRALAQGFTSGTQAAFLASAATPPSLLLALSADLGIHAGNELKAVLADLGGRGGGSAVVGQGSLPDAGKLANAVDRVSKILQKTA